MSRFDIYLSNDMAQIWRMQTGQLPLFLQSRSVNEKSKSLKETWGDFKIDKIRDVQFFKSL